MADNVIGIKFGVAGEGSISGESGKLIKSQLEQIAKAVNLQVKVNINKTHFRSQLADLKKEIDSTLGGLNINIGTTGGKSGGSGGSSGGGKSAYSSLLSTLNKINSLQKQIDSANIKGAGETVGVLTTQMEELKRSYESKLLVAKENKKITDEEIATLENHKTYLERLTTARRNDTAAAEAQSKIDKANKQKSTKKNAWDGLYANAQRLLQREDYLIQNNKEAAASAERLAVAMRAGFDASTPEAATASVERLRSALKQTDAELAEIGTRADTFGFKIKKAFKTKVVQNLAYALLALVGRAFRQVYKNVIELDKAITDLQIATGMTRKETGKLVEQYAVLARELGATVTQVTSAADTWLRQGYSVAETNQLITNTLMLSKLGQIESADAARALTSAMKGYKVEVGECIKIVDKLTAVDMIAAVTAGDIATAMAETATSADIAGISMDRLIGYISVVSEVTQDGAESVGTFYKTLFARIGSVKAGKFVDDETGESLNDVESVLNSLGISLRDESGDFKEFGVVLDDVARKWDRYSNVQQHALATAFAGTRQQEKFIVLMENYGAALDYAAEAESSAGTAHEKYQEAYLNSIEAKLDTLTAAWQDFSTSLLDSEIVKFFIDFLSFLVEILDAITEFGDGMLIYIPAITVALVAMWAILIKIKKTTVFMTFWTQLKSILAVFPAIIAQLKATYLRLVAERAARKGLTTQLYAQMAATQAATAAQEAWNATNPIGWMILAASVIIMIVQGLSKLSEAQKEAARQQQEILEKSREQVEATEESIDTLAGLMEDYKSIMSKIENESELNSEIRKKLLEIQEKINKAVGAEASSIDLINGKYEEQLALLFQLQQEQAKTGYGDAVAYYGNAVKSADNANDITSYVSIGGIGSETSQGYEIIFEAGKDASPNADKIAEIIEEEFANTTGNGRTKSAMGAGYINYKNNVFGEYNVGDKYYGVDTYFDNAQAAVDQINAVLSRMTAAGYNISDSGLYSQLSAMRDEYQKRLDEENKAKNSVLEQVTNIAGFAAYRDSLNVESKETYDEFRSSIIDDISADSYIKEFINSGKMTLEDISTYVDNFISEYYGHLYDRYANISTDAKYSFGFILNEIQNEYDILRKALKEIEDEGLVSADTIKKVLDEYPDMQEYFVMTANGYQVVEGAMDSFLEKYKELYGQGENENTWNAVIATLTASDEIEKWIEEQEKIKEAYEGQLDKQKELIEIRKDLLKTYKEEVKYQEQLAQKQRTVADLRTKLALAKLDTSAAGKARVRELEKELEESEDELDDFTLENAIEKITQQMEDGYSEYEKFIQKQIDRIETAINNAAGNYKNGNVVEVPEHHTGGFVGGVELQSHEEFAKLMKGEFVVTPSQMSRFMGETLPTMVGGGTGGEVNYNAPLITIKCDSITKEAVPEVEKIVNEAVNKIKTEIDSAFSRTGFKKKI